MTDLDDYQRTTLNKNSIVALLSSTCLLFYLYLIRMKTLILIDKQTINLCLRTFTTLYNLINLDSSGLRIHPGPELPIKLYFPGDTLHHTPYHTPHPPSSSPHSEDSRTRPALPPWPCCSKCTQKSAPCRHFPQSLLELLFGLQKTSGLL